MLFHGLEANFNEGAFMKKLGLLLLSALLLQACANDNNANNVLDSNQLMGITYDSRISATSRVENSSGSVRFDEPRFIDNGSAMKLWAYGPIFAGLEGNSYQDHMNSACALLAGPGSRYETHLDSAYVAYGEYGVVLDGVSPQVVGIRQVGRFGDYDLSYWGAENSKYVQSITCYTGRGAQPGGRVRWPVQPRPGQGQPRY